MMQKHNCKQTHSKYCFLLALLLVSILALSGCGTNQTIQESSQQEDGYTFTDAIGQEITVHNPQRVVSLMGSFSEIWILAGGADTLVGTSYDTVDNRDLGLPEDIAIVGTYQNPNIEEILALNPDLVLLSSETTRTDSHVALKDALNGADIPAAYFSVTHFEDYLNMLKICTDITGNQDAYQTNGIAVEERIAQIIADSKTETSPSVLLMITYSGGIRAQSSDTMTGKMLSELGCKNILDDYPSMLQDFSVEKIIETDPDYIFVIPMGNDDALAQKNLKENVESNPAWNSLTAVKNDRYILLPKDKFLYKPNAVWDESYAYLAALL
ncbi:MAG: ABC transporter substrate-binding protein, partial [Peptococcaceae bacterium]|nr:ABC transporter substrate-binding protein [Peptococcaceae bacterium]